MGHLCCVRDWPKGIEYNYQYVKNNIYGDFSVFSDESEDLWTFHAVFTSHSYSGVSTFIPILEKGGLPHREMNLSNVSEGIQELRVIQQVCLENLGFSQHVGALR